MRVAVLGAAGTIAPAIVRDLAFSDEVDGLVLLDIDDAKAEQVASLHGGTKARAALVDARVTPDDPSSLARALWGFRCSSREQPAPHNPPCTLSQSVASQGRRAAWRIWTIHASPASMLQ